MSQLATDVSSGQVKQIKVNGDELDMTMSDGSAAVSQIQGVADVTDTLKNLGVTSQQLQSVDLEVVNQSGWDYWAGLLLPPLLELFSWACSSG